MPYIKQQARVELGHTRTPANAGELNYCITREMLQVVQGWHTISQFRQRVMTRVMEYWSNPYFKQDYQRANDIIGAMNCALLEFYRRRCVRDYTTDALKETMAEVTAFFYDTIVAPYEDGKIEENGDVYS